MPELPEVEVTRRGIAPHIEHQTVEQVVVRHHGLRWPVPQDLAAQIEGCEVREVTRRGKYLLLACWRGDSYHGHLLIHLGMTGTLRVLPTPEPATTHEHLDVRFTTTTLRFRDPRRFGAVLWHPASAGDVVAHPLLAKLGVEPFSAAFAGEAGGRLLYHASRGRSVAVKPWLLAGAAVVGVGNIYASESLFRAGIHPETPAGRISLARYQKLAEAVRHVLAAAIDKGGSTLRDFVGGDGKQGYFQLDYFAYDRATQPCRVCGRPIRQIVQGQRSTFYCPQCQKR